VLVVLQAINQNGQKVILFNKSVQEIEKLKTNKHNFICPVCKGKVYLRSGKRVIPHFVHYSIKTCDSISRGESIYHDQGKMMLYRWLLHQQLSVKLEPFIQTIRQRPDILLIIGRKRIAIEYQCSPISPAVIKARNDGYRSLSIFPIWIIGAKYFQRKSRYKLHISSFIQSLIHQFSPTSSPLIFFFCPYTSRLITVQDLYMVTNRMILGKITDYKLSQVSFIQLFHEKAFSSKELYSIWHKEKHSFRTKQRGRLSKRELNWHRWLYEKRLHLHSLPSIIHLPISSQYMMRVPLWNWQSKWVIERFIPRQNGEIIQLHHRSLRNEMYQQKDFSLTYQVSELSDPLYQYLRILSQLKIVKKISAMTFIKLSDIDFPTTIEEAIAADKEVLRQLQKQNKSMFP
jgi:competence protein CoiA